MSRWWHSLKIPELGQVVPTPDHQLFVRAQLYKIAIILMSGIKYAWNVRNKRDLIWKTEIVSILGSHFNHHCKHILCSIDNKCKHIMSQFLVLLQAYVVIKIIQIICSPFLHRLWDYDLRKVVHIILCLFMVTKQENDIIFWEPSTRFAFCIGHSDPLYFRLM